MYNVVPFTTKNFPNNLNYWRIISHGEVTLNPNIRSEPQITLFLAPSKSNYINYDNMNASSLYDFNQIASIKVGIGQFTNLPVGSILYNKKRLVKLPDYNKKTIKLSIDKNKTSLICGDSTFTSFSNEKCKYIPSNYYFLPNEAKNSKYIFYKFGTDENNNFVSVIIPCLEILRFYWGTSSNLIKQIVSGGLEIGQNQIYDPDPTLTYLDSNNIAHLRLRPNMLDTDARTIARIAYDKNLYNDTQNIYDSMLCNAANGEGAFPVCFFPFVGETTLEVRGKNIKSGDTWFFLVYQIESCSGLYPYEKLRFDRDNDGTGDGIFDPNRPEAWSGSRKPKIKDLPDEETKISDEEEPTKDTIQIEISLPPRKFLDIPEQEKIHKEECKYRSAKKEERIQENIRNLSTGSGTYGESGSDQLLIKHESLERKRRKNEPAPKNLTSFLQVLEKLKDLDSKKLSYELLNFGNIADEDFDGISRFPSYRGERVISWAYFRGNPPRRRQLIAAKIQYYNQYFYLFEAEKRPRNGATQEHITTLLIYKPHLSIEIAEISHILLEAAENSGVWLRNWRWETIHRKKFAHGWSVEQFANNLIKYFSSVLNNMKAENIGSKTENMEENYNVFDISQVA